MSRAAVRRRTRNAYPLMRGVRPEVLVVAMVVLTCILVTCVAAALLHAGYLEGRIVGVTGMV